MHLTRKTRLLWALALFLLPIQCFADVSLPNVLSSHMVLQRDQTIRIWGNAEAGEKVSVAFAGQKLEAISNDNGHWQVHLKAQKANSQPQNMTISGNNTITLSNILIGDVWIGSGQSNMEWRLEITENGKQVAAKANHPAIRLYHVPKIQSKKPETNINAKWKTCTPQNTPKFSATLFYFGRKLHLETGVPIGLINSSWGGSPIEPWFADGGKMYNAMIAPLHNYAIKGFTWYQGETNVIRKNGLTYFDKKKTLIEGWRKKWNNNRLSFYFVQIAPWAGKRYAAGQLPALWEAQTQTLSLPHTGMAVTTDIVHNINDIHPRNKLDVGERLARWALVKDYGKTLNYSGPIFKKQTIQDNKIIIEFAHVGDGFRSRDNKPLNEFQIAGADGKFVPAKAVIKDKTIVVSSGNVMQPTQVRFGWHKIANPNLTNMANLPASPFQTKNWQGATGE